MGGIASKNQLRMSLLRWALVTVPLVLLLGFVAGRSVPAGDRNGWYVALIKPPLTPPGWAFPLAWSLLYILMGVALAVVINARGARARGVAIVLFVVQLAFNLAWTPVFFGLHRIGFALGILVIVLVAAIATTVAFGRVRPAAAWLMLPYLVWVSFAGMLNLGIMRLNPNAETLVPGSHTSQML